jgi:hypothetical protein
LHRQPALVYAREHEWKIDRRAPSDLRRPARPPFAELRLRLTRFRQAYGCNTPGDIFEMEDQRNWTDASKPSAPLHLPYPVPIESGTRVEQSITFSLRDERAPAAKSVAMEIQSGTQPVTFNLQPEQISPLPVIGLGVASHGQPLSAVEISRLKALHLDHLRSIADFDISVVERLDLAAERPKLGFSSKPPAAR